MSKPPAFQFYPSDFLSDDNVDAMTAKETGGYIRLLCHCWKKGYLNSDTVKLDKLARLEGDKEALQSILGCFEIKDGKYIHKRLDAERVKQKIFRDKCSEAGKVGAEKRWGKNREPHGAPKETPMGVDGSASSTASLSSKEIANKATLSHASYFFSSKGMADFLRSCGLENEDALTRVYLTAGKKATLDELVQAIVEKKFFKKARSPVGMAIDAVRKGYHPSDESHAKMKELLSGTKRNQAAIPGTTRISPALRKAQEVFKANIPLMERNKIFAPSQLMNHPIYKTLIGEGNGNVWIAPNGERQTET